MQWFKEHYPLIKMTLGVIATLGLYSMLYRENRFYRFFEHLFLGLASGWTMVAIWTETLYSQWWGKMVGSNSEAVAGVAGHPLSMGYWLYAALLPIGLMAYFVFNPKYSWMSRIPIGIIIGLYSGQQIQIWWNRFGPQINNSLKPVFPTTWDSFVRPGTDGVSPEDLARISANVYPSQALSNAIFVATLLCVLSYFLFSFAQTKFLHRTALA
ncbi:MAG: hypothetical protein HY248_04085, partial [Fimbriimonas ginsengisoli]|nr:hypothetical protein [Fimbriimonas ginsengisoli]